MVNPSIPYEQLKDQHTWYGPGRGCTLRMEHIPSGITVERRTSGNDNLVQIQQQLLAELKEKLRGAGLLMTCENPRGETT